MKKFSLLFIILIPLQLAGQMFRSSNQQLIEDAIRSGLILYTHSYQLQDTTTLQKYGRNGQDDFGKSYSIGIRVKDGFVIADNALVPWLYDGNFDRYRNAYRPISHKGQLRVIRDTTVHDCNILNDIVESYHNTPFHRVSFPCSHDNHGFSIDTIPGSKAGWLVWIISDNKIDIPDSLHSESYMIFKREMLVQHDSVKQTIDAPQTEKKIWGGIYITPIQTDIGQISFFLTGILSKAEDDNKWLLYTPFVKDVQEEAVIAQGELTPISINDESPNGETEQNGKKIKKGKKQK